MLRALGPVFSGIVVGTHFNFSIGRASVPASRVMTELFP